MREGKLDAILTTASGCGTMIKDYGHLLARDRGYAGRAAEMAERARDITEFIQDIGLVPPLAWTSLRVAYHSACSLQHGQQVETEPRGLLSQAGFTVRRHPRRPSSAAARPGPTICFSPSSRAPCASGS